MSRKIVASKQPEILGIVAATRTETLQYERLGTPRKRRTRLWLWRSSFVLMNLGDSPESTECRLPSAKVATTLRNGIGSLWITKVAPPPLLRHSLQRKHAPPLTRNAFRDAYIWPDTEKKRGVAICWTQRSRWVCTQPEDSNGETRDLETWPQSITARAAFMEILRVFGAPERAEKRACEIPRRIYKSLNY